MYERMRLKGKSWSATHHIPVAHADSFRISIDITAMQRLTSRNLDASNAFQNRNVPIHERFYVIPPPYYLDRFERYYPNVF